MLALRKILNNYKYLIFILILILTILIYACGFITSQKKVLRIMTYSSFASVFGPGNILKEKFEKTCDCQVKWIKVPDSTLFIQRLALRKDGFKTDVVMGLDQLSLNATKQLPWVSWSFKLSSFLLSPPVHNLIQTLPKKQRNIFIPYNWSPMTFLSRHQTQKHHLMDLLKEKYRHNISLPAPRTSTVGLQFLYWVWFNFQNGTRQFLQAFKNQLYGLPPSWSTSYSLFQRGHVDLSFSYFSSLLYHIERKQQDFYPVLFKEGHPFQVEFAAVSGFCVECTLAQQWVSFLMTDFVQKVLLQKNYMFPVLAKVNSMYLEWQKVKLISYDRLTDFLNQKNIWLKQWK